MTRHPKPIPTLSDAWRRRTAIRRPDSFHQHNPAPEDFAAGVIANHVRTAIVELKRAHHYATQFSGVRFREVAGSISQHAARAGEYAAYSGRPLDQWHAERADELAVPSITAAFDAQFQATTELLATPEEELEDEGLTQNPPRRWPSSEVQSLLFDTEHWTATDAKRWAKDHGFRYGDVDTTDRYHHLRQFDPIHGRPCRTVTFEEDAMGTIKAKVCAAENPPPETYAVLDRNGNVLGESPTPQGAMDKAPPGKSYAIVRGEYTSDGTYHGVGRGRQVAVREFDPSGGFRWYQG